METKQSVIENLESKISALKQLSIEHGNAYKLGKVYGMMEGFDYSISEIRKLPNIIPIIQKIFLVVTGICVGLLIGFYFGLSI